jgi:iron complex transport system substrate-binding protein
MKLFFALIAPLLLCFAPAQATTQKPGLRVVSQTVATDELLIALAEPSQIAALSHLARDPHFCAIAREAMKFPQLAPNSGTEGILKHRPNLVLFTDYSQPEIVAQTKRSGVEILVLNRYHTLDDTWHTMRLLAKRLGRGAEKRAEDIITHCKQRLETLEKRLRDMKPTRVISPSTYGIIPGDGTNFQDFCNHAKAENLAKTHGQISGHMPMSGERILTWPVEKLVLLGRMENIWEQPSEADIEKALAPFRLLAPYRYMSAVKRQQAVLLNAWQGSCVTHHRVACYEYLARQLHPEAFRNSPPMPETAQNNANSKSSQFNTTPTHKH